MRWRHHPAAMSGGNSHVANAQITTARPAISPRVASTIGASAISTMWAPPATTMIEHAPIDTQ